MPPNLWYVYTIPSLANELAVPLGVVLITNTSDQSALLLPGILANLGIPATWPCTYNQYSPPIIWSYWLPGGKSVMFEGTSVGMFDPVSNTNNFPMSAGL